MATTTDLRARLHGLVDELPDGELAAAVRFLEFLSLTEDPVLRALRLAPPDDEPVTEEDLAAFDEGMEAVKAGRVVSHEEALRQLFGDQ